ncbi:MAG: hypothetical protein K0Q46_3197 [Rhodococcus erythropolis]|jgi:hypothetical protein|nr:hypothetical protein [Rhodococcus erythropolis]MDF2896411.1 hypothetical protein [Rhodococcus erythropolis]
MVKETSSTAVIAGWRLPMWKDLRRLVAIRVEAVGGLLIVSVPFGR